MPSLALTIVLFTFIVFFSSLENKADVQDIRVKNNIVGEISKPKIVASSYNSDFYLEEETEKVMIKSCFRAQAWILLCQECYTIGNTSCPYPTDSFCSSVKNVSHNDSSIVWGFLPNDSGLISEIQTSPSLNPANMNTATDIPLAIRFIINRDYSYDDSNISYIKPVKTSTQINPCAIEGIITK